MWQIIGNLASLAGLFGVSILSIFQGNAYTQIAIVALVTLFFIYLAFTIHRIFKRLVPAAVYENGYRPISSFVRYSTSDGNYWTYEAHRHIQIKKAIKRTFAHKFFWSGSNAPQIHSSLQAVGAIQDVPGSMQKEVILTFPRTRIFNDIEVVHVRMDLDDTDHKSEPFISQNVKSNIRLIVMRVELLHTDVNSYTHRAKVTKKSLTIANAKEEHIADVIFEKNTKSFSYELLEPEPEFEYKLTWIKP